MEVEKQNREEVERSVKAVLEKIAVGKAPAEMVALYKSLGPEAFGYWLNGYCCGLKEQTSSQISTLKSLMFNPN